jgi:multiple antibiotic resistance protein
MHLVTKLSECFVPLFVAMSPLTVLPMYLTMTDGMDSLRMRSLSRRALLTAFAVALVIILAGQLIFRFLGITVDDLRVAGGVILFVISSYDLVFTREQRKRSELASEAGVVPLGVPLIVGPATMTTCVVLADTHGRALTLFALLGNLVIIGLILHYADNIKRFIRPSISRAFGKVMSLFLAAIAVAMARHGVAAFIQGR